MEILLLVEDFGVTELNTFKLTKHFQLYTIEFFTIQVLELEERQISLLSLYKKFFLSLVVNNISEINFQHIFWLPQCNKKDIIRTIDSIPTLISLTRPKIENETIDYDTYRGKVVITQYNNSSYLIGDVDVKQNPLSTFQTKKGETFIFYDYYLRKYQIKILDEKQPLLITSTFTDYFSLNEVNSEEQKHETKKIYLVPEITCITSISPCLFFVGRRLLISICDHIQVYYKISKFCELLSIEFNNKRLLRQCLTHPTYSNEYTTPMSNYQRLEFIGDSVLNFLITAELYQLFPENNEGKLSRVKTSLVNNKLLYYIGLELNVDNFILIPYSQQSSILNKDKIIADVVESLLGVIFLEYGLTFTNSFLGKMLIKCKEQNDCINLWNMFSNTTIQNVPTIAKEYSPNCSKWYKHITEIQQIIGVHFNNIHLLRQAFTHPSYNKHPNIKGKLNLQHYQQIEFLGDALLELIISNYLYAKCPTANEGELTLIRSHIVNNDLLCKCIRHHNLHEYLLHYSSFFTYDGPKLSKAHADLFESILAAIYISSDFDTARNFVIRLLIPKLNSLEDLMKIDDKSLFQNLTQIKYSEIPTYKIHSKTKTIYGIFFEVGVYINNKLMCIGEGDTLSKAAKNAALKGIEIYTYEDHYTVIEQ